jgi:hypothetical protein
MHSLWSKASLPLPMRDQLDDGLRPMHGNPIAARADVMAE